MDKVFGFLGLCARAGKLCSGEQAVLQAVQKRRAYLVLADSQASANTQKELANACAQHDILFHKLPGGALGAAIGRQGRMTAAVTDRAFSDRLINLIETNCE